MSDKSHACHGDKSKHVKVNLPKNSFGDAILSCRTENFACTATGSPDLPDNAGHGCPNLDHNQTFKGIKKQKRRKKKEEKKKRKKERKKMKKKKKKEEKKE